MTSPGGYLLEGGIRYEDLPDPVEEEEQWSAAQFEAMVGRKPHGDDLDRLNCHEEGMPGHMLCGYCARHDKPRFECGCMAEPVDGDAQFPRVRVLRGDPDPTRIAIDMEKIRGLPLANIPGVEQDMQKLFFREITPAVLRIVETLVLKRLYFLVSAGCLFRDPYRHGRWTYRKEMRA